MGLGNPPPRKAGSVGRPTVSVILKYGLERLIWNRWAAVYEVPVNSNSAANHLDLGCGRGNPEDGAPYGPTRYGVIQSPDIM